MNMKKAMIVAAAAGMAAQAFATSPFGPSVADDLIAGKLKLLNQLYR